MLGITDWSQFWIAFWSSLFAGAIDSLLIGLIVGVMILVFQWKIDERRLQHKCEQEVARFRELLRFALDQPETTYVDSLIQPSPRATSIAKLLSESPLDLWIEKVPRQQKFFTILKEFQQTHSAFILIASKLRDSVASAVRKMNSRQGTMRDNDSTSITYFTGRTLRGEPDEIIPWASRLGGNPTPQAIASFEASYNLLLEDEKVKELTPLYQDAWQKLEKAIDTLRGTLDEPPNPKR
jgi:hypothetical protein